VARRDLKGAAAVALGGALAGVVAVTILAPQLWLFHAQYGGIFAAARDDQVMRWDSPFFWEVLYSSSAGLFTWTPLAYVAVIGLFVAPRDARRLAAILLVFFVLVAYTTGATWAWTGGWSYGARRMLSVAGVLVVGMALFVERLRMVHARWPRLAPHAALILALGPLVLLNTELSGVTAKFQQRVGQPQSSIDLPLGSMRRILQGIQDKLGSPTSWPANWVWALRHGASPKAYDFVVGGERLAFHPRVFRHAGATESDAISMAGLGWSDGGGFGPPVDLAGKKVRWALPGRARVLLPLHVGEDVTLALSATPAAPGPVRVAVNGTVREVVFPAGLSTQAIPLPEGVLHEGTNDVDVLCGPAPPSGCLAVERLSFTYRAR
jgi:hypothetical protein